MKLGTSRNKTARGFAMLGILLAIVILAVLFLTAWHFGFSGDGTNTIQTEAGAVNKAKELQQKINAQSQDQQNQLDTFPK